MQIATMTQRLLLLAFLLIPSGPATVLKKKHIARAVTMKISSIAASLLAAASTGTIAGVQAFISSPASARCAGQPNIRLSSLSMSSNGPDDDMLKASAEQMKNMQPEDIDRMMAEMESMGPAQKAALKSMGMEPDLMMRSMKMMRDNPQMAESARKMMEQMTPEELMEQSRLAQNQMSSMDSKDVEAATKAMENLSPEQIDAAAELIKEQGLPTQMAADEPLVLDTMYRTAEMMTRPPTGGVSLQAFATLPPISVLSGTREEDLSQEELEECWAEGTQGKLRADRAAFERVWKEVQEYFEGDIMEEARKTAAKRSMKGGAPATSSGTSIPMSSPAVGANLSADEMAAMNARVKDMSEDDVGAMLEQMSDLTPEQEARMKAMGADPQMMAKAAKMMSSNPMMKKAAANLMKNMSPEDMMKASQQAQKQMSNMSEAERRQAMENIEKMDEQNK